MQKAENNVELKLIKQTSFYSPKHISNNIIKYAHGLMGGGVQ